MNIEQLKGITRKVLDNKFPKANMIFLAGSYVREEATPFSDLDLVVLYDKVEKAYRESFIVDQLPVEAFVHDVETLAYFFDEIDKPTGCPSLAEMVLEGVCIPEENNFSLSIKKKAQDFIDKGPEEWTQDQLNMARYGITDLVDDIRSPLSNSDFLGAGARLYETLGNFYFRSRNKWSAKGKTISRKIKKENTSLALEFDKAFFELYQKYDPQSVIQLAEKLLSPYGGLLFDKFKLEANESWRK